MEEVQTGDGVRLVVSGELDLATADQFTEKVQSLSAAGSDVFLDLSGVDFMDSTGLNALVNIITDARGADRRIEVAPRLGAQVERLLQITGVAPLLLAS